MDTKHGPSSPPRRGLLARTFIGLGLAKRVEGGDDHETARGVGAGFLAAALIGTVALKWRTLTQGPGAGAAWWGPVILVVVLLAAALYSLRKPGAPSGGG